MSDTLETRTAAPTDERHELDAPAPDIEPLPDTRRRLPTVAAAIEAIESRGANSETEAHLVSEIHERERSIARLEAKMNQLRMGERRLRLRSAHSERTRDIVEARERAGVFAPHEGRWNWLRDKITGPKNRDILARIGAEASAARKIRMERVLMRLDKAALRKMRVEDDIDEHRHIRHSVHMNIFRQIGERSRVQLESIPGRIGRIRKRATAAWRPLLGIGAVATGLAIHYIGWGAITGAISHVGGEIAAQMPSFSGPNVDVWGSITKFIHSDLGVDLMAAAITTYVVGKLYNGLRTGVNKFAGHDVMPKIHEMPGMAVKLGGDLRNAAGDLTKRASQALSARDTLNTK